ncbi:hypothetical protein pb186bvf_012854 [Paramecium bursaria]
MGNQNCGSAESKTLYTSEVSIAPVNLCIEQKNEHQSKISDQSLISNSLTRRQNIEQIEEEQQQSFLIGYCNLVGHNIYRKIGFCMNKQCKEKSRFICSKCKHEQLHKHNHSNESDIIDEYQMAIRIKDNYNKQIKIYNYCSNHLDAVTIKLQQYSQQLLNHINELTGLISLEQINQQIEKMKYLYQNNQTDIQYDQQYLLDLLIQDQTNLIENQLEEIQEKFLQIQVDVKQLVSSQSEVKVIQNDLQKFYCQKNQEIIMNSQIQQIDKQIFQKEIKETNHQQECLISRSYPYQSDTIIKNQSRTGLLDQLYRANKQQKPKIQFKIGLSYYISKNYESALEEFQEILQQENQLDFYEFYYYLGKCYLKTLKSTNFKDQEQKTQHHNKILDSFKKSYQLNEKFSKIYPKLCQTYLILQDNANAADIIKKGYKFDQDSAKILYYYGKIEQIKGDFNTALKYYNQCLIIKPNYSQVLYEIGFYINNLALIEFKKGNYDQVFFHLNKIIQKNPNQPELYLLQSKAFWKTGNIHKALQQIDNGRNKFPFDSRFIDRKKQLIKELELENPDSQLKEIDEIMLLGRIITKLNQKKIQLKQQYKSS